MSVDRKTITSNDSWYTTFVYNYLFIYFYSCGMKFAIISAIGKRKKIGKLPTKGMTLILCQKFTPSPLSPTPSKINV